MQQKRFQRKPAPTLYTIRGKAYWAKLHPETAQDDKYTIDICNLNAKDIEFLKKLGLAAKTGSKKNNYVEDERGQYLSAWTYAKKYQSDEFQPTLACDAYGEKFDQFIGNGSDVTMTFAVKDWTFDGKSGKRAQLYKLQVDNLVEAPKRDNMPRDTHIPKQVNKPAPDGNISAEFV